MVDCLNQSSKHCGKMPRQQKTDHAKALANLAFWAILTCISLPVLSLTLLQRSLPQIISGCISHLPVLMPKFQLSCKLPFLWIFVCSVAYTHKYDIATFSPFTVKTWCERKITKAKGPDHRHPGLSDLPECAEGTGTLTLLPVHEEPNSLTQAGISLPALCSRFSTWHLLQWAWEKEQTLSAVTGVGLLGDSRSQRGEAVDEIPPIPVKHTENRSKSRVLKEESLLWAVPVFYPLTHPMTIKWLHGNTANVVFQEFILAFDVAAIMAQSFWSAVISFNNQNYSHSESFFPSRGSVSYHSLVPHWEVKLYLRCQLLSHLSMISCM